MELIVVAGAATVIYCGYLSAMDELRDWKRLNAVKKGRKRRSRGKGASRIRISVSCPEGGAAAHWREPLRDSF